MYELVIFRGNMYFIFSFVFHLHLEIQSRSFVKENCVLFCLFCAPHIFISLQYSMTDKFTNSYNVLGKVAFASQRNEALSIYPLDPVRKKPLNLYKERPINSKED